MDHRRSPVARLMLLSLLVMEAVEASAAAATAVRPLKSLDVVDATGQLLGPVMSLDGVTLGFQSSTPGAEAWMSRVPTVVVEAAGRLLPLRVFRTYLMGNGLPMCGTSDCTGPVYFDVGATLGVEHPFPDVFIVPATVVASPGQTVYVPDPSLTVQVVSLNSVFIDFGVCSPISLGSTQVIAGVPVIDLSSVFTPPYRLR